MTKEIETTLDMWKNLQKNNYFENHPHYKNFPIVKSPIIFPNIFENKTMVEIGCGYGRETAYFSKYVKKIYGIEVESYIIEKAKKFVTQNGNIKTTKFVLAENYKKEIPNNIDIVYSLHVFQHCAYRQIKDYIDTFYQKLKKAGLFYAQFYIGDKRIYEQKIELNIQYTVEEIKTLFKNYTINTIQTKLIYFKYKHLFIKAIK